MVRWKVWFSMVSILVGVSAVVTPEGVGSFVGEEKVVAVVDDSGANVNSTVSEDLSGVAAGVNVKDATIEAEMVGEGERSIDEEGKRKPPQAETGLHIHLIGDITFPSWSIGLLLGIVGYTLAGLGMNLIRLSHLVGGLGKSASILEKVKETRFNRRANKNRASVLWTIGYGVNGLGGTINSFGLKFTAQSLMAPLSSVALVSNAVFATCLNGETLRIRRDLGSIFLIFIGNCITVSSGNHAGFHHLELEEVFLMWTRPSFLTYLGAVTFVVILMFSLYLRLTRMMEREGGRERASPAVLMRLALYHACGGCMLGVNSVLMAKSLMLILAGGVVSNFLRPGFLLLSTCWATVATFWLYTLNRLLKEYDALFIVPVIEVVWSIMSMISGGIFFDEYTDLYGHRLVFFLTGVCFNVTGIWLIGHGKGASKSARTQV